MAFLLSNIAAKAAEERKKKESQPETASSKPSVNSGFFLTKAASEAAAAREQSSTTRQTVQPTPPAQQTAGYDPRRQAARTAAYLQPKEEKQSTGETITAKTPERDDTDLIMAALNRAQTMRNTADVAPLYPGLIGADPMTAGKLRLGANTTEAQLPDWEEKSRYAQKYMPGTAKASAWNGSYYGPGGSTGSEDIVYDYINSRYLPEADAEKVRGIMAVNEANSGITYKGYDNLPEETVNTFNYIYATKGKDEAYKYLEQNADRGMLGAEAASWGLIQGSGALSLASALASAYGDVKKDDEIKQAAADMYGVVSHEVEKAKEQQPFLTRAGESAGAVALMGVIAGGISAIPGLGTLGTGAGASAAGSIAGNALRTAATFGTSTLVQGIGGAAVSDDPLNAYTGLLKNVMTSSMAGAAGGAASAAIGAAGTNYLLEHNLYTNALARKLVAGLGSLGFTAGAQTVEQGAAFAADPQNYKPDGAQILESAVTQLAFSMLAGLGNDIDAEEAAATQDRWNAARNATRISSAEQELAQKYFGGMTEAEAKAEYRRLAKMYHPDTGNGDTAVMAEVTQAYDTVQKYFASLKTTAASTAYADMQTAQRNGDTEGYKNALALLTESVEDLNAYYAENGVPSQDVADALAIVNSVVAAQSPNATPATVPVGSGTTFPPANVPEGGTENIVPVSGETPAAVNPIAGTQTAATEGTDTIPTENAAESLQAAQSEAAPSVTPEQRAAALQGLQSMAATLGENGGKAMTANFDESSPVRMDDYVRDFSALYNAAREGREVKDYPQTPYLTQAQQLEAFKAGRADRAEALQTAPANGTMETERTAAQPAVAQTEQTTQPASELTPYKQAQLEVLQNADVTDEWLEPITSAEQIKTYAEAVAADRAEFGTGVDFDLEAAEQALSSGEITVYSPRAITAGSFVTPSRVNAEDMAGGGGRIYSMTVPLDAVAWTDAWSGQYTGEMEDINNGREGNGILSGNGNGTRSASAGEQARGMESRAGESESRNGDGRVSEEAEGGRGENARGIAEPQKVSSAQLGVPGGIDSDSVVRVTEYTTEADKAAKAKAEEYGYKLVGFKGGSLHVKGVGAVRACIVNGTTIYARLDHPNFTGVQLIEHEHTHPLINNGAISLDSVRSGLSEYWSEDALRDIIDGYATEYPGMTPEEAFVEIVCDAQGGMNIFAADGGAKARVFQAFLDDVKAATDSRMAAEEQTALNASGVTYDTATESAYPGEFSRENDTRLGTQKITAGMTDTERYNILSNRKITIHGKTNNAKLSAAEIATKQAINGIKDLTIGERKKLFKKIGEEFGVFKTYNNADVELEFSFSRGNAAESSAKQEGGRYEDFAKMLSCFDEVINDAIGVEVHNRNEKGYKPDATLSNVYVLMSAFEDADRIVPVKLEIKEFKEKNNTLHVAVALQSIKKSEIVNATKAIDNNGQANASPSLTANIADIFRKINPNDTTFTKYLPIQYRNDALYLAAVNSGDMENAQRMVDEAAKAAGYTIKAYHGSRAKFNVFSTEKRGSSTHTESSKRWFFAADYDTANSYYPLGAMTELAKAHPKMFGQKDIDSMIRRGVEGKLYSLYIKMTNPLEIDVAGYDYAAHAEKADAMMEYIQQAEDEGRDGIIMYHVRDNNLKPSEENSTDYLFRDSSQAKSADPVTYDDEGNVIPLSERFNPENEDIRFSREPFDPEALEEQNEQLRKDLQAATAALARAQGKAAYWEGQTKRSKAPSPDPTDINRLAHELVGSTDTNLKAKDIAPELTELGEFIMRNGDGKEELTFSGVKERAAGIAHRMLENYSELTDSSSVTDYKDIRRRIRDYGTIQVPGNDLPPDWTDFKRRNGWLRLAVSTGTPLDLIYTDLSASYPWFFPEDANPGSDQLYALIDGVRAAEPSYWNPNDQYMAAATEYLANQIIDGIIEDVSQDKTFADRAAKRLSDQKIDSKEKLEAQKEKGQAQLDALRAEKNAQLEQERKRAQYDLAYAVHQTRLAADERLNNLKAHYKEAQENARARRAEGNMRTRLLKIAKRLQDKKLPTPSRALVNEYVGYIDTVAKNMTGKTRDKLQALSELYNYELENNPDFTRDEAIEKKLSRLNAVRISDLTIEQVQDLIDVLLGLEHQLNTAKRELDSADRRDVYQKGVQIIGDVKGGHAVKPQYMETLDNLFVRNTLSPLRELRRQTGYVDGDPLYEAGLRLNRGQLRMNDYVMKNSKTFDEWVQDKEFMESLTGKKAKTIKVRGTGMDGQPVTVEITPDMRISLYLHNRNLQNQQHISSMSGGVKVPDMKLYRAGKISEAYAKGTRIRLQPSEIRAICENMTAKERALAERIYKYFNTTSRNALSDEFERLKGYMMRFVEDYFPIDTDGSFTKANAEAINFDGSLEGSGWLKERVVNAKNPIMLYDATSVLLKAIQAHGQFVGLAVPIRDFTKLYGMNGPVYDEAKNRIGSQSVKETIKQTWGTGATDYIDKMLGDLQKTHTESNSWTDLFRQIRSNYAGATLALNLSVALKQAGSYPTAAAVLGWRPLARAMADFGKVDLDYIASLTPLQWLRSQGYSTPELGDLKAKGRQLPPALNWIQGMDLLTTRKLWKACEYYMQENHPDLKRGSDQYNGTISELYNRVIEETQPNYTVMQRPQLLRSNNELLRDVSMFKTQLFQNFNIFYDAFGNMAAKHQQYQANPNGETKAKYEEAKKNASRASSALIVQSVVIAAMTLTWNALRGKLKRYKDEEKDKITGWSFAKRFGLDVASGFFSMVPFGSEIFSMISSKLTGEKWYGFEGVTTGALTDFFSTIMTAADQIGKSLEAAKGSDTAAIQKQVLAWEDIAENTAKVFGVPAENVMNLIKAVYGSITKTACGKYYGEYLSMLATTPIENNKGKYYDLLYKAQQENPEAFWEIYNSLIEIDAMASDKKSTAENIDAALKQRAKKAG